MFILEDCYELKTLRPRDISFTAAVHTNDTFLCSQVRARSLLKTVH